MSSQLCDSGMVSFAASIAMRNKNLPLTVVWEPIVSWLIPKGICCFILNKQSLLHGTNSQKYVMGDSQNDFKSEMLK